MIIVVTAVMDYFPLVWEFWSQAEWYKAGKKKINIAQTQSLCPQFLNPFMMKRNFKWNISGKNISSRKKQEIIYMLYIIIYSDHSLTDIYWVPT